jgi:hypothetical protein
MSEMPHTELINQRIRAAARSGRWDEVLSLLAEGGDPNLRVAGTTPLMSFFIEECAGKPEDIDTLAALVRAGAAINREAVSGRTPLTAALARYDQPGLVAWLLKNGADPNLAKADSRPPLWDAVEKDLEDETDFRTRLMLDHGACPDYVFCRSGAGNTTVRAELEKAAQEKQRISAPGFTDMAAEARHAGRLLSLLPPINPKSPLHEALHAQYKRKGLKLPPKGRKP